MAQFDKRESEKLIPEVKYVESVQRLDEGSYDDTTFPESDLPL